MSKYRKSNTRVDNNQMEIVEMLRQMGASVSVGHDDILVGWQGRTYWFEIKNADGKDKLQPGQKKMIDMWKGHYQVVHSVDEIIDVINRRY